MRSTVVCLCGSTKFRDAFEEANLRETLAGKIVLSIGFAGRLVRRYVPLDGQWVDALVTLPESQVDCTEEQKRALDELHLRKIDLADEVLVLNVGGYVGESTRREIAYARSLTKPVRWLELDSIPEDLV